MMIVELLCTNLKYPWQGAHPYSFLPDTINLMISESVKKGERPVITLEEGETVTAVTLGLIEFMKESWNQNPVERPNA